MHAFGSPTMISKVVKAWLALKSEINPSTFANHASNLSSM